MFFEFISEDGQFPRSILKESPIKVNSIESWTSLVRNDTASHLFSFYFMWENPTWNLIDQDAFLYDLENRHETYCSHLLVHVLLFFGCVRVQSSTGLFIPSNYLKSFSYRLNHITDRREEKILGQKLYDQIQLLWEKEKMNLDVPTIQSGILLGLLSCTFGIDRLGTQFIMSGAKSYSQQGFHIDSDQSSTSGSDKRDLSATELSREMVSWAIYDVQAWVQSLTLLRQD